MPAVEDNNTRNWEITESQQYLYSDDEIIEAYLQGRKYERDRKQEELQKSFQQNLKQAAVVTQQAIDLLTKQGYHPCNAFLRPNHFADFNIILTVSEDDFLDDGFPEIYNTIHQFEQEASKNGVNIFFDFVDESPSFSEEHLKSDGYVLKYARA